jgi:hypothetical protein
VDIIPALDVKFDLVFIDADKKTIILISFFQNEQGELSFLTMYWAEKC